MINEKISFNYKIPSNKEQLMYDFYILVSLPVWLLDGHASKAPVAEGPAMKQLATEATKKVVKYLKKDLLDAVHYSMASEFRHALAFSTYSELEKLIGRSKLKKYVDKLGIMQKDWLAKMVIDQFDPYAESYFNDDALSENFFFDKDARDVSYSAIKDTWSDKEFAKLAEKVFSNSMWKTTSRNTPGKRRWGDYGGRAWANIAKGYQKLDKASSLDDQIVYIDHIFDLQHNTDSVLNKVKSYGDSMGRHTWIGFALENKKHAKSLFALIHNASPTVKSFAARVIKAATGETWEKWTKSIDPENFISSEWN